ncbi:hypothetical protein BDF20DRAFT_287765 [Mycotypha africana]|uniref:uncharacterized protein n=1 Tax=Mycotypha africana TaxID=64632 RepID=UPI002301ED32|nr:uncharacterized protein BDF20DRAFT_287765 [Mycotypha africana]KAI8987771.1 hypothetical protein BDF20DRAFT_287765 [Mycotypha africana]
MVPSRNELFNPSSISAMDADISEKRTFPHSSHFNHSSGSSEHSSPSPTFSKPQSPAFDLQRPTISLLQQHCSINRRESLPSISYITQPLISQKNNGRRHSIASREISVSFFSSTLTDNRLSLQNKSDCRLHYGSTNGSSVYTRSPELKISHKLAERKRRKEMKNLFDDLRDALFIDKNIKVSKWEILSRAVKHIDHLKKREAQHLVEKEQMQKEIKEMKHVYHQ